MSMYLVYFETAEQCGVVQSSRCLTNASSVTVDILAADYYLCLLKAVLFRTWTDRSVKTYGFSAVNPNTVYSLHGSFDIVSSVFTARPDVRGIFRTKSCVFLIFLLCNLRFNLYSGYFHRNVRRMF